ncbi:hypothetical protein M2320_002069 [Rhodoblastus acidophilus]|nr:hypothetical protein [Rhodoblastus acidophilus]
MTSGPIFQDAPGNLRANLAKPTIHAFSLAFIGPTGRNHEGAGCVVRPNFNDGVAWWIGPGRGMTLKGVAILGPNKGYRCAQPAAGIGVAISVGASLTHIEDTWVENFYTDYSEGAQGSPDLADSNTFVRPVAANACVGIHSAETQAYITSVYDMLNGATTAIMADIGTNIHVFGGNLSVTSAKSNAFRISNVSALTPAPAGNLHNYTFTATIGSPDPYVGTPVYNAYTIYTPDYGVIPVVLTAWNSITNLANFQIYPTWGHAFFGRLVATTISNISDELQAATTLYAAEMVTVIKGEQVSVNGAHIENPLAPTTLINSFSGFGANGRFSKLENIYFNYDASMAAFAPENRPTPAQLALYYAQMAYPFINISNGSVDISDTQFGLSQPVLIDFANEAATNTADLYVSRSLGAQFNERVVTSSGGWISYGQPTQTSSTYLGAGHFDRTPFLARLFNSQANGYRSTGFGQAPMWGFRPASYTRPCITPGQLSTLTGALPPITGGPGRWAVNYPLLWGGQAYQLCDWYVGSQPHYNLVSDHHFYSYGQTLPTNDWSAQAGSFVVRVADTSLFFPGLGVQLATDVKETYIITGVYPGLGYITVGGYWNNGHSNIHGALGTSYTGATIGQEPYIITQW